MKIFLAMSAAMLLTTTAAPVFAQSDPATEQQRATTRDRLSDIFGSLFGDRTGGSGSLESQWAMGRTPLGTQRAQFDAQVDAEVRSGAIAQYVGTRLKSDYADLVALETSYGSDRRFTTAERTELANRYAELTRVLQLGSYSYDTENMVVGVAEGRVDFNRRVDAAISSRRITRVTGTRLRTDYAAVVRIERGYLRDGRLTVAERDDLENRLDALDARVGDVGYGSGVVATPRARLDAIARSLPSSGLSASLQTQLRIEHEDLSRLENAYARLSATADDRTYLDRRITDLEIRARIRR